MKFASCFYHAIVLLRYYRNPWGSAIWKGFLFANGCRVQFRP